MIAIADHRADKSETSPYWRLLGFSNFYRFVIACALVAYYFFWREHEIWDNYNGTLYLKISLAYLVVSLAAVSLSWLKRFRFDHQLTLLTITDIGFIVALIYAAGGLRSGLGLLLVVSIASASLISQGRLALFYAALASIALLLEQSYQLITWDTNYADYTHAAMLSLSCFVTAWVGYSLAKRMSQSEALASQRGVDLESLAQTNALIIQEMKDGVLVVGNDFRLRHHNFQAEDLLGNRELAWNAMPLKNVSPELAELMQNWVDEADDTTDATSVKSNPIKLSIEERELSIRFMPVDVDRRQGAIIFIEDWSQMQSQAQQQKLAALGRLTANIAHEIRNPLSAISHANQLLQEDDKFEQGSQRMLQIIEDNVKRMDQIVQDVLELNRRDRTHQETILLKDFLFEFHNQFCQVEKIPPAGFELNLSGRAEHIMFDRRHLNQILWNLCRNGWRHSKQKKASLTLSLHTPSNAQTLRMEITDDGPGVSPEAMQHLFEPFFTTESTGSGLGLYIARELCEANGGSIKYAFNKNGSQFIVYLKRHASK